MFAAAVGSHRAWYLLVKYGHRASCFEWPNKEIMADSKCYEVSKVSREADSKCCQTGKKPRWWGWTCNSNNSSHLGTWCSWKIINNPVWCVLPPSRYHYHCPSASIMLIQLCDESVRWTGLYFRKIHYTFPGELLSQLQFSCTPCSTNIKGVNVQLQLRARKVPSHQQWPAITLAWNDQETSGYAYALLPFCLPWLHVLSLCLAQALWVW